MTRDACRSVVVTGSNGFVGRNVCSYLRAAGYRVLPICRAKRTRLFAKKGVGSDLSRRLHETIASEKPDAVIHAAGKINGSLASLTEANEKYTLALVKLLEELDSGIRLIFISSVSAVGSLGRYGASKKRAEEIIEASMLRNWLILQPSLLYGRHDTKNVALLLKLARVFPIVPLPGRFDVKLQPLFVDDLCAAICGALANNDALKKKMIIAGPAQEYLWDMVGCIQSQLGRRALRVPIPLGGFRALVMLTGRMFPFLQLPVQQAATLRGQPKWDSSSAETAFGCRLTPFSEGIQKTLALPGDVHS